MKKLPALALDLAFICCANNHLHIMLLDKDGKEIAEFIINDKIEASAFSIMFAKAAIDAFEGKRNVLQ